MAAILRWLWSAAVMALAVGPVAASEVDATSPVRAIAAWAADGDAAGRPYAIVDKRGARLHVFSGDGRLVASTPVLIGAAVGDTSMPGVRDRVRNGIPAAWRTTPAGRFESVPGHNDRGEAVVWVDYGAAVAIHRLRPAAAAERRPQRLASPTPADNRISLGCVVVPEAFYDAVVEPWLGHRRATVYVLPDSRDWTEVFPAARAAAL